MVDRLPEYVFRFVDQSKCEHEWEDHINSWTEVTGDGHLVIICKKCGYVKHLEDT